MEISEFFKQDGDAVFFEETQASRFAKEVAGDFNPIHDPGSKRFCVPGDLLFSVVLNRYGVAENTKVEFAGMLGGDTRMILPQEAGNDLNVVDDAGKPLLQVAQSGRRYQDSAFIAALCSEYVKFSGQTFPGILVPLMRDAEVMINPARPLVIYKDMTITFNPGVNALFQAGDSAVAGTLAAPVDNKLSLQSADHKIVADGRKGSVRLSFTIEFDGQQIGTGEKNMLLSGLREYDEDAMMAIVDQYNAWRRDYSAA